MNQQRGVALIIVLMIVALVAVIATEMGARLQLQVTRATNIKDNNQAYWYAMGAEQFARKSILQLLEKNANVLSLEGGWSEQFTFPLEGGGIQAQLTDMQSCFNLNGINPANNSNANNPNNSAGNNTTANQPTTTKQPPAPTPTPSVLGSVTEEAQAFERLLSTVVPELDNYSVEIVRDSLTDWLDADENLSPNGAEDPDYAALVNPYLAANAMMVSKTELRLVNGVQPQWINKLLPHICVIPDSSKLTVNVNTLTEQQAPLLAALTGAPLSAAESLIANRKPAGYETVQEFTSDNLFSNYPLSAAQQQWFEVKTEYFLLHTKTRYNNATFAMSSLFKVANDNTVTVLRREFGGKR